MDDIDFRQDLPVFLYSLDNCSPYPASHVMVYSIVEIYGLSTITVNEV